MVPCALGKGDGDSSREDDGIMAKTIARMDEEKDRKDKTKIKGKGKFEGWRKDVE